jgi:hypothetical protein
VRHRDRTAPERLAAARGIILLLAASCALRAFAQVVPGSMAPAFAIQLAASLLIDDPTAILDVAP